MKTLLAFVQATWWQFALVVTAVFALLTYRESLRNAVEQRDAVRVEAAARHVADSLRDHREYVAKRRDACYDVYDKERRRFANALGPEYLVADDVCTIRFKSTSPAKDCSRFRGSDTSNSLEHRMYMLRALSDCETNTFANSY